MKIIETCPKCGCDLTDLVIATYPPIPQKKCFGCGWEWTGEPEEVIRVPFGGNSLEFEKYPSLNDYTSLNIIVDDVTEKEIQENICNTIGTIMENHSNKAILGLNRDFNMNKWISVNTRLPEDMVDVLCWYEYRAMDGTHEGEMIEGFGIGRYFSQFKIWGGEVGYGCDTRVIAWMPLPEPYKED